MSFYVRDLDYNYEYKMRLSYHYYTDADYMDELNNAMTDASPGVSKT